MWIIWSMKNFEESLKYFLMPCTKYPFEWRNLPKRFEQEYFLKDFYSFNFSYLTKPLHSD